MNNKSDEKSGKANRLILAVLSAIMLLTVVTAVAGCETNGNGDVTDTASESNSNETDPVDGKTENEWGVKYTVSDVKGTLSPISDLNKGEVKADDHAGETQYSQLMPNYRENYKAIYDNTYGVPTYSRIKKLNDGRYMMIYIDAGSQGIIFRTSENLEIWTPSVRILSTYKNELGHDVLLYSPDAVVLDDGTIVVVSTFHDYQDYWESESPIKNGDLAGIVMIKSTDGGKTWSEKQVIYTGINWEPMLLQLKSGELQCYFTNSGPYIHEYGYMDVRSTGAALIRSFDGGETWTPNITGYPYEADRVIQTYVGLYQGIKYYTDQMPVAVELNNGKIAVACEAISLANKYYISVNVTDDNWKKILGKNEEGPYDKYFITRPHGKTYAPYIGQFESGETVIHIWDDKQYALYVADENAHNAKFSTAVDFKGRTGRYWCNFEIIDSHSLVACSPYGRNGDEYYHGNGILLQTCYLNHRINATERTVTVDGELSDWKNTDDALFVGAKSQAQAAIRTSVDENNIYFLIERLDEKIEDRDITTVNFTCDGEKTSYRAVMAPTGEAYVETFDKNSAEWVKVKADIAMLVVNGNKRDEGYAVEISIPKSELVINGDTMNIDVTIENYDDGKKAATEEMFANVEGKLTDKGYVVIG